MKAAKIDYEKPNPFLYQFKGKIVDHSFAQIRAFLISNEGSIEIADEQIKVPLDANNFLLRGSSLRSEYAIGVVVYTG